MNSNELLNNRHFEVENDVELVRQVIYLFFFFGFCVLLFGYSIDSSINRGEIV